MKPKTWIFIIAIFLLIAFVIVTYFSIRLVFDKKIPISKKDLPKQNTFYVDIRDYGFMPENITIEQGEKIVWKNLGTENHSLVFFDLNISSGNISISNSYNLSFNYSGNFSYVCGLHPDKVGTVFVK